MLFGRLGRSLVALSSAGVERTTSRQAHCGARQDHLLSRDVLGPCGSSSTTVSLVCQGAEAQTIDRFTPRVPTSMA